MDIALTEADSVMTEAGTGKFPGKGYSAPAADCTVSRDFFSWLSQRQRN